MDLPSDSASTGGVGVKVGVIMRKVQFHEAQGPRRYFERLQKIGSELGVEIIGIVPQRHVSEHGMVTGFEYEKGDLVNYDIVLEQIHQQKIEHVIYTVAGFSFLKLYIPHTVLFPHSFPDPALPGSSMMLPFYQMVEQAIVQTEYLKERCKTFGVSKVDVIPIGFEEDLALQHYNPLLIKQNRILWIGRDESNRRPELVFEYARLHPHVEVVMVFGGLRYQESIKRFQIPSNVRLYFGLKRDEIFSLMNSAKVYWNCSYFDTFAMPLTEALAMGKLIVQPEHPCYGHTKWKHVYCGNDHNYFDLLNMCLAAPIATSEANREYAFSKFGSRQMRDGYERFFQTWLRP
jgi:hypothetical protein